MFSLFVECSIRLLLSLMFVLPKEFSLIDLSLTLRAGQVFCWDFLPDTQEWIGVIGTDVFKLFQDESKGGSVSFTHAGSSTKMDAERALGDFFQVDVDFCKLLDEWRGKDKHFLDLVGVDSKFNRIRICRQDPFECLISFIVSANNNIKRISQNLKSIRARYGTEIAYGQYSFPRAEQLGKATVEELRELGLGYRAEYIVKTVGMLKDPEVMSRLNALRKEKNKETARNFLTQFQGVGRKVADCVALYSLDFPQVAPVDTHMFQIAQRLFSRTIKKDNRMHDVIQDLMQERFGETAGWAHCFLFATNLRDLRDRSPAASKRVRIRE